MGLILCNQHLKALERFDNLDEAIPDLTSFQQYFSLSHKATIDRIIADAGDELEQPYEVTELPDEEEGTKPKRFKVTSKVEDELDSRITDIFPNYQKVSRMTRDDIL